jgi:hypothetical protein
VRHFNKKLISKTKPTHTYTHTITARHRSRKQPFITGMNYMAEGFRQDRAR